MVCSFSLKLKPELFREYLIWPKVAKYVIGLVNVVKHIQLIDNLTGKLNYNLQFQF